MIKHEYSDKAHLEAWSQPGALTGGLNYYRASGVGPSTGGATARTFDRSASSAQVRVPTLVIWGEADTALLPGNIVGLDALVADLTIKRVPNGTHWVVHERPELVNRLIREFLTRVAGRRPGPAREDT